MGVRHALPLLFKIMNRQKTWIFLFGSTAGLFSVVGLAKIIADSEFLQGGLLLIVAVVLTMGILKIRKNELDLEHNKKASLGFVLMASGFVFLSIGTQNLALLIVGFILFLSGLFATTKKKIPQI